MKYKKSPLFVTFLCIVLIVIWLFVKQELTVVALSDAFFLACFPFAIAGITKWLLTTGFFDYFHFSMRRAMTMKRDEKKTTEFVPRKKKQNASTFFWLKIAANLLILAIIFLLLSYI